MPSPPCFHISSMRRADLEITGAVDDQEQLVVLVERGLVGLVLRLRRVFDPAGATPAVVEGLVEVLEEALGPGRARQDGPHLHLRVRWPGLGASVGEGCRGRSGASDADRGRCAGSGDSVGLDRPGSTGSGNSVGRVRRRSAGSGNSVGCVGRTSARWARSVGRVRRGSARRARSVGRAGSDQRSARRVGRPCSARERSARQVGRPCWKNQRSAGQLGRPCWRNPCSATEVGRPCWKNQHATAGSCWEWGERERAEAEPLHARRQSPHRGRDYAGPPPPHL